MAGDRHDAAARLWWALRRHAVLLLIVIGLTTGAAATFGPPPEEPEYRATALIIARELHSIRPEHLPRMAQAIFTGGTVAEQTVATAGVQIENDQLIPDFAQLEPIEGTVLVRVVGTHPDATVAADIANAAAEALISELNRGGPEVGTFASQEQARVPEEPEPGPLRIPPAAMGLVAGLILGTGLVGLLMVLRRPVLAGGEVSVVTEAPLLGTVALSRRRIDAPEHVHGMSALLKRLYPGLQGICVFISPSGARQVRSSTAGVVARGLARSTFVCFVPAEDRQGQRVAGQLAELDQIAVSGELLQGAALAEIPVVVDGPSAEALDLPQFLPADARPVLVVPEGSPARRVTDASSQFLPGELAGVLFVARSRGRSRKSRWRRRNQPGPGVQPAGDDRDRAAESSTSHPL